MKTIQETDRFLTFATQSGQVTVCAATIGAPIKNNKWDVETNQKGEVLFALWGGKRATKAELIARFGAPL